MINFLFLGVAGVVMLLLPLPIGRYLAKKYNVPWSLFAIGMATFFLSQVGHIPFNGLLLPVLQPFIEPLSENITLLLLALFLGLSAGLFEEGGRYLVYRYWAKDARTTGHGLMMGAGHGGLESMLVGLLAILSAAGLYAVSQGGLVDPAELPAEAAEALQMQLAAVMDVPWYEMFLGAVERVSAVILHMTLSLLVLRVFMTGKIRWLGAAIFLHTLFNGAAVILIKLTNIYWLEAILFVMAIFFAWLVLQTQPADPELVIAVGLPPELQVEQRPLQTEDLEDSQFME